MDCNGFNLLSMEDGEKKPPLISVQFRNTMHPSPKHNAGCLELDKSCIKQELFKLMVHYWRLDTLLTLLAFCLCSSLWQTGKAVQSHYKTKKKNLLQDRSKKRFTEHLFPLPDFFFLTKMLLLHLNQLLNSCGKIMKIYIKAIHCLKEIIQLHNLLFLKIKKYQTTQMVISLSTKISSYRQAVDNKNAHNNIWS